MAIVQKDGFRFFQNDSGKLTSILLNDSDIKAQLDYAFSHHIFSVSISGFFGFSKPDLNFFLDYPLIESVDISDVNIDIKGLYGLSNLKHLTLGVKSKKQHLDLSIFKYLEFLSIDWYSEFPDLSFNLNLQNLFIWKFKPKSFSQLLVPNSLRTFHFTDSNIVSFEGINIPNLIELEAHNCSSLQSLKGIESISTNLTSLILDYCKKLSIYDQIRTCKNLSKLILGDCGEISSLDWIKDLDKLKHFSFYNTKLKDGNIFPCIGIDFVSFKNSKQYNLKMEDLKLYNQ